MSALISPLAAAVRPPSIDFRDVRDPAAFVQGTIAKWQRPTANRGPIVLSQDERDELFHEGMAILCKLAVEFEPHREGYEHAGRFSGYAAQFLPRKLGDAWHRLHEEHLLVTGESGKRQWKYGDRAVSLEAITEADPERQSLLADDRQRNADVKTRLHRALYERWCTRVKVIVEVGELLSEGATAADCAEVLGITGEQVREAIDEIAPVISRLQSEDA